MKKECRHCKVILAEENGSRRHGAIRDECKSCFRLIQQKKTRIHPCEVCGIVCIRKFLRAFCSDRCRIIGYSTREHGEEGCWMWSGSIKKDGYGSIMIDGKDKRAHRASFEIFNGPIGKDKIIRHECHTPACVNPNHLREGTPRENIEDMLKARRSLWGERCHLSKFNKNQIRQIRESYKKGSTQSEIANKFGTTPSNISFIVRKITWPYL